MVILTGYSMRFYSGNYALFWLHQVDPDLIRNPFGVACDMTGT